MKKRSIAAIVATAVMTTAAADYCFPTANPPGGKSPDDVKQIVTFIWDDNAYSGLVATDYEPDPNSSSFTDHHWVGGKKPWGAGASNGLNIQPGDMGMSWAISELVGQDLPEPEWKDDVTYGPDSKVVEGGKVWETGNNWPQKGIRPSENNSTDDPANTWGWAFVKDANIPPTRANPDGSPLSFTFNVISGLFVPIIGTSDGDRVSKFGYWAPNDADIQQFPHLNTYKSGRIPIAWGREMMILAQEGDTKNVNDEIYGQINEVFKMTNRMGHEIGNHTIDHLESNSMLPQKKGSFPSGTNGEWYRDGFAAWGGEGFADGPITEVSFADTSYTADERVEFGRLDGITWHSMGWDLYAGKMISANAWKGVIELGEEDLEIALGVTPLRSGGTVGAFRAPRLEVNSGLHYALKELGYQYDCGLEEGYEYNVDGTNFVWPYTTDNGSPNVSWQRSIGEKMSIDSMPAGLWQLPVNTMIVPEDIREGVWARHAQVARAEFAEGKGHNPTAEDSTHWVNNSGKVTGFDFNMFILWGMTKDDALTTLKYNLDQRLIGNKAPMQVGCHTDYFTPIYDNATLQNETNVKTYGLCVTQGWNDWEDRKATFDEFIDYGLSKGAYFYSGKQTIDYVASLMAEEKAGKDENSLSSASWSSFKSLDGTSFSSDNFTGDIDATINIAAKSGDAYPFPGFGYYPGAGSFDGLTHISLDYNITAPVRVRIQTSDNGSFEVWLNSLKNNVKSGKIPLYAFHRNQFDDAAETEIDPSTISGIEFEVIASGKTAVTETIKLSNIKYYSGDQVVANADQVVKSDMSAIALKGLSRDQLTLNIPQAGAYSVSVIGLNGRVISQINSASLTRGVNSIPMNNLSAGVYLVKVAGMNTQQVLKSVVK